MNKPNAATQKIIRAAVDQEDDTGVVLEMNDGTRYALAQHGKRVRSYQVGTDATGKPRYQMTVGGVTFVRISQKKQSKRRRRIEARRAA